MLLDITSDLFECCSSEVFLFVIDIFFAIGSLANASSELGRIAPGVLRVEVQHPSIFMTERFPSAFRDLLIEKGFYFALAPAKSSDH